MHPVLLRVEESVFGRIRQTEDSEADEAEPQERAGVGRQAVSGREASRGKLRRIHKHNFLRTEHVKSG